MASPLEQQYHDKEWGVPVHDDRLLFEFLILEGAQAGLSWSTILKKRDGYRQAFDHFDAGKVARYSKKKVAALLSNPEIIRNRLKVNATITNAAAFLDTRADFGSFARYIWQFVEGVPIQNRWKNMTQVPARTSQSDAMSTDLKNRGFKFVGPTICYAFMQAVGMVNDHTVDCFRYNEIKKTKKSPRRLSALKNIGKKIEKRLNEINVFNENDLFTLGSVNAYRQIKKNYPDETLPLCYYLYSFDGALRDVHWNEIGESRKKKLKDQLR
jgi:DNA-3-methyladenine glycosylase I